MKIDGMANYIKLKSRLRSRNKPSSFISSTRPVSSMETWSTLSTWTKRFSGRQIWLIWSSSSSTPSDRLCVREPWMWLKRYQKSTTRSWGIFCPRQTKLVTNVIDSGCWCRLFKSCVDGRAWIRLALWTGSIFSLIRFWFASMSPNFEDKTLKINPDKICRQFSSKKKRSPTIQE